ncbi:NADH-quinone oxidoreductase subunit L [Nitratiruptor sp. YY09-18]|uniref:NADH-quinone oxidoreductase subunit L n=1 Tax=Nitratiruptor sp. YY09-18 TaxID=2724901 RepID=UPI001937FF20|nr:NADH-quinone oxidoreductase subunit L [Nitratiruptor sp. YY09-18]BCD67436.1 NADH-quinone oxidoreductase subunit L [Nitratiruptor sp. YY09-18]
MEKYVLTTLFAPLVGSLFAAMFGMQPKRLITGIVTSLLLFISFVSAVILLVHIAGTDEIVRVELFDWITVGSLNIPFGFVADYVSVIMMVTVTLVSTLVHVYSIGYMEHDEGFNRFFSYLSAFVFSMLVLVMSDNFAGLFIGWEGVGLCSWLLIGFWYYKKDEPREINPSISPSWAANEAFIMNRIADLGMLLGLFLIYWSVGSLQYDVVFSHVNLFNISVITLMGIFLFIGAMGKSAQFPLHTWLADAMEGPTPVSALIHAATMVTAGVYLVIRAYPIYSQIPDVGLFIASLGAFVAVFAASMALVNTDLKRIIAYSTLSQLGYMFVAAGLGAYWVGLFHLMTHAFFKALLFLGAGNVMHAMHDELNIFKMGGLGKVMKWTAIMMIIASLALAGIYPFAGFFSKDKILEVAFDSHHYILWFMLWVGAGMTAFYSFRLIMLVFFGEERYKKYGFHPHEAHWYMLAAMAPLAILAIVAGFFEHPFEEFVTRLLPEYHFHTHGIAIVALIGLTTLIALSGIALAVYKYSHGGFSEKWKETFIYKLLYNQYYIPIIYEKLFTKPYAELSRIAWKELDMRIVDATVDFVAGIIYKTGFAGRVVQSGNLSKMLRWMVIGLLILLVLVVLYSPVR